MIFPVSQLIAAQDELVTIPRTATVRTALNRMVEHDFSQLPIVDVQGQLTGIISEQSIAHTYFYANESAPLFDLPVHNCQARPVTITPDADIFDALSLLRDVPAVVVIDSRRPIGIVTYYDATHFFRNVSEGLMYVEDIEVTLRQYIEALFPDDKKRDAALIRVLGQDKQNPGQPRRPYERLSFYDHLQFITHDDNWPKFESYFEPRKLFRQLMDQVRIVRNQLAHFRDDLSVVQLRTLQHARDWLAERPKPPRTPSSGGITVTPPPAMLNVVLSDPTVKVSSKYAPLFHALIDLPTNQNEADYSFSELEQIIDSELPASARTHRAWWANESAPTARARAWLCAGWQVSDVDMQSESVTFTRANSVFYQLFFADLLTELRQVRPELAGNAFAAPRNYLTLASGIGGIRYALAFARGHIFRIELYIDFGDKTQNKAFFDALAAQHRTAIEAALNTQLNWERLDNRRACRIGWETAGAITDPPAKLDDLRTWALANLPHFVDTINPRLQQLTADKE